MKVGSLFTGIGGLDLGLERAGMEIEWQVECDEYCRRVLDKHWPYIPCFPDIRQLNEDYYLTADLICGGFPCQPVSLAGRQNGVKDERWLWPEMRRVCEMVGPRWVLVENVPGLLSVDAGRIFGAVVRDLAALGYRVEWDCIPAAAVGAPHLRDRVFVVANADVHRCGPADGRGTLPDQQRIGAGEVRQPQRQPGAGGTGVGSHPHCGRLEELRQTHDVDRGDASGHDADRLREHVPDAQELAQRTGLRQDEPPRQRRRRSGHVRREVPDAPGTRLALGQDQEGLRQFATTVGKGQWSAEPDVGRVADGVPARVDRLRCLGNAVVPQVAEYIGRMILHAESVPHPSQ